MADTEKMLDAFMSKTDRSISRRRREGENFLHPDPRFEYEETVEDDPDWSHTIRRENGEYKTFKKKSQARPMS